MLKTKTEKFIRDKIGDKTGMKQEEKYRPLEQQEPTSERY